MQPLVPRQRFTDLAQLKLSFQVGRFQCEFFGWGFFESRWWRNYPHVHSLGLTPALFRQKGGTRFVGQDVPGHA